MKTNYKFTLPMLALAATSALVSCSDKEEGWYEKGLPDPSKDVIAFTSNGGEAVTRASFAGTRAGFDADTKIVMRIKAEDTETATGHTKGADRFTRTYAKAGKKLTDSHSVVGLLGAGFEHSEVTMTGDNFRYWDDAYGRFANLSVYAVCIPNKNSDEVLPNTTLKEEATNVSGINTKWKTGTEDNTMIWTLETPADGENPAHTNQTAAFIQNKDLCFSNNISTEGKRGVYRQNYSTADNDWNTSLTDGILKWNAKESGSTTGRFDQGHLVFNHALCQVTINLKESTGFNNSSNTDFKFPTGKNVEVMHLPISGTFNVATGEWSNTQEKTISTLQETTTTFENISTHTLNGLTMPGKNLYTTTDNVLSFVIDDNQYYVTGKQIAEAIREYYKAGGEHPNTNYQEFTTMKSGEHYVINITVGKTAIKSMTAEIVAWEEVNTTDIDPTHTYFSFNLEENRTSGSEKYTSDKSSNFNLYRTAVESSTILTDNSFADYNNIITGYEGPATKNWNSTKNVWETEWFWPNNKTYYHFRIVGDAATSSPAPPSITTNASGDYFTIKGGALAGPDYKDYIWGAPFTDIAATSKFVYDKDNGFNIATITDVNNNTNQHQLYRAIGATNDNINLMAFHMTSQITVNVSTSTGNDKVELRKGTAESYEQTKVEILRFYEDGQVLVGSGATSVTGDLSTEKAITFSKYEAEKPASGSNPAVAAYSEFTYGLVPQALSRSDAKVGLRITTPDGNQYIVKDLSTIEATVSATNIKIPYAAGSTTGRYVVNYWYPNYKYTYNVTIIKTGIMSITAELVDWETVTGNIGNITLED